MLNTARAYRGMVTAPHHLASGAGRAVLKEGGNALEAMIAKAATVAVAYPHMNGIGGEEVFRARRVQPLTLPLGGRACSTAAADPGRRLPVDTGHC
jgi:gamma-glutamyltranspeptidase/glutathione hydrolase